MGLRPGLNGVMHAGVASGSLQEHGSTPAGPLGSFMDVDRQGDCAPPQHAPQHAPHSRAGAPVHVPLTRDGLLHEGSGETHPAALRRLDSTTAAQQHSGLAEASLASPGHDAGPTAELPLRRAASGGGGAHVMPGGGAYMHNRHSRGAPGQGMAGMHEGRVPQAQERWGLLGGAAAPVDDADEDETYLQRLVELQEGIRWEGSQAQQGASPAAESSLPDAAAHRSGLCVVFSALS